MQAQWLPQHLRLQHHHPNIQRIGEHTVSKPTWQCKSTFSNKKYILKKWWMFRFTMYFTGGYRSKLYFCHISWSTSQSPFPKTGFSPAKPMLLRPGARRRLQCYLQGNRPCHLWPSNLRSYWAKFHDYFFHWPLKGGSKEMIFHICLEVCSGCEHCMG